MLMKRAFREIEAADLVVIELSEKGVGVGIEAGYARAKGNPIIVVARQGSDISATMEGIADTIVFYRTPQELAPTFRSLGSRP